MAGIYYTSDSTIKEVLKNPIGNDIIVKILMQTGKSMSLVKNPLVGSMKLKSLMKLSKGAVDAEFLGTLTDLLNSEKETPDENNRPIKQKWWKESVVYQIYPRSFMDSNGDGIGDLNGIISKLDYLQNLGVDILWLSPIYDSPNDDNGYDIRDYQRIMKEFGTMKDFDHLLSCVHQRGMKLIMDLVINHTSDEHMWFQSAVNEPDSPYRDFYHFKKSEGEDVPPNNWTSFFSGSAWNYYRQRGEWGLHLFSKKQMDLNWDNPNMREALYQMINSWLNKGIDGFRLDVINYISKKEGLPNGSKLIGEMMGFCGVEHYFYGPNLHRYLQEMRENTFNHFDVVTVGETPGVGMEMAKLLTDQRRGELDMVFGFDHLENPGKTRFDDYRYDLTFLKEIYTDWQLHYGNASWNSLFYENHDNPRMISKVNPNPVYRGVIAKLLSVLQFTLKGTPFLFQGQELGMINSNFTAIEELRDVESINLYNDLLKKMNAQEALHVINSGTRDHARTPMQWSGEQNGGFTSGTPWLKLNDDYKVTNAEQELSDRNSVLDFYTRIIKLRKENKALVYGKFVPAKHSKKELFCYYRTLGNEQLYIELNLTDKEQHRREDILQFTPLISNYESPAQTLRPYEASVYCCR